MSKIKGNSFFKFLLEFIGMTLGSALAAFALREFLVPNSILDGGVTGISIIVNKLSGINLGVLVFIINIPFVYVGYKNLGNTFLYKALYSMALFAVLLEAFADNPSLTSDPLLAVVFGGALLGIGVGLVIMFGGCVDGTESVALVISKKTSFSVGQIVLCFNLVIYGVAGIIFGMDRAMYSLLTYFITFKLIDMVSEGLSQAKSVMIITDKSNELTEMIYSRLGRTSTVMEGAGLISGKKVILYVVLTRIEVPELKKIISEIDESAFVAVSDVSEIIGNHIKSTKEEKNIKRKHKTARVTKK